MKVKFAVIVGLALGAGRDPFSERHACDKSDDRGGLRPVRPGPKVVAHRLARYAERPCHGALPGRPVEHLTNLTNFGGRKGAADGHAACSVPERWSPVKPLRS